ncbi:cleavage and polyadenylation specificity factor subunit 1 [Trichinella spiralis]|uniref:cleavage and polyadenylation specificity factor subunit 1 n=1 Tax=Trichinella spiralis TaxID=6334 RepID=UPI0001EFD35F|nr:cleavage and polyadenylation specificity factor subunit 1 [Trichinella spiralis]
MYAVHRQTDAPTAVNKSMFGHFTQTDDWEVVVACDSYLKIYKLRPAKLTSDTMECGGGLCPTNLASFELVLSEQVYGRLASVAIARLTGFQLDVILLAIDDAKLSVVGYDIETHSLVTLSMHYYEDDLFKLGFTRFEIPPMLRMDPERRCAAMTIYGAHLVVLPLVRESLYESMNIVDPSQRPGWPFSLRLTSYTVAFNAIDAKMHNVTDMCFLHGFYEPTVLLLYEPTQTTAGRVVVRQDTYQILAVSLNPKDKTHAVIWTLGNLPFDAFALLALPKPLGGVLLFSVNSIIYLNQSVPCCGILINDNGRGFTNYPLRDRSELMVTLDGSHAALIDSANAALVLRSGLVFVVSLLFDRLNMVKEILLTASSVRGAAPSTVSACVSSNCLFVGSAIGNSALYAYEAIEQVDVVAVTLPARDTGLNLLDDMQLYGELIRPCTTETLVQTKFEFRRLDQLASLGPCRAITVGESSVAMVNNFYEDYVSDWLVAGGPGTDGSFTVMQRSVRPRLLTQTRVEDVLNAWSVGAQLIGSVDRSASPRPQYMLLTTKQRTVVFTLSSGITEIFDTGFEIRFETIACGDMMNGAYVVQVTKENLVLLHRGQQVQCINLRVFEEVCQASVIDPYVALIVRHGHVLLFGLVSYRGEYRLAMSEQRLHCTVPAVALCLYKDTSSLFVVVDSVVSPSAESNLKAKLQMTTPVDEDDLLLYGEPIGAEAPTEPTRRRTSDGRHTYWLVLAKDNGDLEIYSVPDLVSVDRPFLFAVVEEQLLIYEAFHYPYPQQRYRLSVRFKKVRHTAILQRFRRIGRDDFKLLADDFQFSEQYRRRRKRSKHDSNRSRRGDRHSGRRQEAHEHEPYRLTYEAPARQLSPFENVAGYAGLFIGGGYPYFCFLSKQGDLRLHPMHIDGPVVAFAPYCSPKQLRAFAYFTADGMMRVSSLPSKFDFDRSIPSMKVELGRAAHFVVYLMESHTYALTTSEQMPCHKVVTLIGDDKQFETFDREAPHFIYPTMEQFKLQLYSADTWLPVPGAELDFDEFEHVTACQEVQLKSEGSASGLQSYLAIGTVLNYGEEVLIRGRLLIIDVVEVVPEPDRPMTKFKLKVVYSKEQKGPVTSLCSLRGYLLTGMGQKVYIWQYKDNALVGISFLDLQVYVHQMASIRYLALTADAFFGVSLLRYQEEYKALSLVSRDPRPDEVLAVEFLVDRTDLSFLMTSAAGDILTYVYLPESLDSFGGQRLVPQADYHFGSQVNAFVRMRCHAQEIAGRKRQEVLQRQGLIFASSDGSVNYLLPLPEREYRLLGMLQSLLIDMLPSFAGLNVDDYRTVRFPNSCLREPTKNIIDGNICMLYLYIDALQQEDIVRQIGSSHSQIMLELAYMERQIYYY